MKKNLIREDKFDSVVRTIVKDIISLVKFQKKGEFGLPEDLKPDQLTYSFPKLNTEFSVFLDLKTDENVNTVDVDGDYYSDEEMIYVTIKTNPKLNNKILQELIGELHELIRHELEHIKQHEEDYVFPKEPKDPEKYYTQKHELDAQKKGFEHRAKKENKDFEFIVRKWFENNRHKHNLGPEQIDFVVGKIISHT